MQPDDSNNTGSPELQTEGDKVTADVKSVFKDISLLQIKKAFRDLMEMAPESLEGFVQKHSDFVIFLLNILDEDRSTKLLSCLTDAALIYLSEEELRNLLIKKVGQLAVAGRDFNSVSIFMDFIDRPIQYESGIKDKILPEEKAIISLISECRSQFANRHFLYLDRIGIQRREELCVQILERNFDVALGLLLYCPDMMLASMLDLFAKKVPGLLRFLPDSVYYTRFKYGYSTYITTRIRKHLPVSVQKLLIKAIKYSQREEENILNLIQIFASMDLNPMQKKKYRLEQLSKMVRSTDIDYLDLVMFDLVKAGIIESNDIDLIRGLHSSEE